MLDRPEIIASCLTQFLGPEGRVMPLPQAVHMPARKRPSGPVPADRQPRNADYHCYRGSNCNG